VSRYQGLVSTCGGSIFDPIGPDSSWQVPVAPVFVKGRRDLSGVRNRLAGSYRELARNPKSDEIRNPKQIQKDGSA